MKWVKIIDEIFSEVFTLIAWGSLLTYIWYCTANDIEADSIRDAWNIMLIIAGFVWGAGHQKAKQARMGNNNVDIEEINIDNSKPDPAEKK